MTLFGVGQSICDGGRLWGKIKVNFCLSLMYLVAFCDEPNAELISGGYVIIDYPYIIITKIANAHGTVFIIVLYSIILGLSAKLYFS